MSMENLSCIKDKFLRPLYSCICLVHLSRAVYRSVASCRWLGGSKMSSIFLNLHGEDHDEQPGRGVFISMVLVHARWAERSKVRKMLWSLVCDALGGGCGHDIDWRVVQLTHFKPLLREVHSALLQRVQGKRATQRKERLKFLFSNLPIKQRIEVK